MQQPSDQGISPTAAPPRLSLPAVLLNSRNCLSNATFHGCSTHSMFRGRGQCKSLACDMRPPIARAGTPSGVPDALKSRLRAQHPIQDGFADLSGPHWTALREVCCFRSPLPGAFFQGEGCKLRLEALRRERQCVLADRLAAVERSRLAEVGNRFDEPCF